MFKNYFVKLSVVTAVLAVGVFGAACGSGNAPAQTTRVRAVESPTPGYKPPKRVSRDVIKAETKEVVKAKAE